MLDWFTVIVCAEALLLPWALSWCIRQRRQQKWRQKRAALRSRLWRSGMSAHLPHKKTARFI
ncbi:MAG: hypothetical protein ACRCYV_10915 [Aeromonas sp.]